MWNDVRSVLRALRREPRFSIPAILTLALGISAATAIFTVVNRVILRPVAYPNPDRIVYLGWEWKRGGHATLLSARKFQFWRDQAHLFDGIATYQGMMAGLGEGQTELTVRGLRVSSDFFHVLGASAAVGRMLEPDETQPNGPPVVILSYSLWKSRFGLDRGVLNRQVRIDGRPYTVVGVMSPTFRLAETPDQPQVYLPLALTESDLADKGNDYQVIGRLRPGVTLAQARADLAAVMDRFRTAYPDVVEPADRGVIPLDYREIFVGNLRVRLWVLFGATGFVLLLACANVANLLLARAIKRRREITIRSALGATRGRIVRLFVAEGLVLGLLAAAAGVVVSVWGLHALLGLAPAMLPVSEQPELDGWVLAFSAGLAIVSGAVLGIVHALPALRARDYRGRLPGVLIAAESALAIVLLTGAGLLMTTLARTLAIDPGFARTGVLATRIPRTPAGYDSAAAVWSFDQRLLANVRAIPGVLSASSASNLPFDGGSNLPITVDGNRDLSEGAVWWRAVSPSYFTTLGVTVIRGRDITETDGIGAPGVVIVNKSLAARYWPGQDPIGHRIAVGQFQGKPMSATIDEPPREVIGVVADTRQLGLTYESPPMMFVPQAQVPPGLVSLPAIIVRATNTGLAAKSVGRAIAEVDPRMPPPTYTTIDELVERSVAPARFSATLMAIFASLALIVTCIGIYGVASYAVASRTRDIGVRMALGAPKHQVVALVVQQGMLPVAIGLAVGLAAALMLARLLTGMIYGVTAHDPATLAIVTGVLAISALIGTLVPARRAARIDPLIAIRGD